MADDQIDLLLLQERCRKDPISYRDEYTWQQRHFAALLASARLQPSEPSRRLAEVSSFMGAVAHCYGNDMEGLVPQIANFLSENVLIMHVDLRRSLVRLLGLLRARNAADATIVIPLFFRLLECNDKALRRMLHGHIVSDIKKMNTSGHCSRRVLQTFLFAMMEDPSPVLVKRSLHVLVDLFRKRIWNDAKCANMIANACFHPTTAVAIIATKFVLDSESKEGDVESDDEDEGRDAQGHPTNPSPKVKDSRRAADMWKAYNMTAKKSSKKRKRMERVINRVTRIKKSSSATNEQNARHPALEAMMLLHDPQTFTERLFTDLQSRRKKERYETRLIFINLISRLIGTHKLILFTFYPFLQRYLQPSQPEVTRVLAYLTQACHDMLPPDVLHPILKGLADTFVSERSSPIAMAAGINSIRAICARVPLAILDQPDADEEMLAEEESALLLDLVQYKAHKDKGVSMAGRSLLGLYREVCPALLAKKDRGKAGAEAVQRGAPAKVRAYGEHIYATGVEGAELLNLPSDPEESGNDAGESDDEPNSPPDGVPVQTEEPSGDGDISAVDGKDSDADGEDDDSSASNSDEEVVEEEGDVEEGEEGEEGGKNRPISEIVEEGVREVDPSNTMNGRKDESEILSNADYARIRARQAARAVSESVLTRNTGDAVDPDDIQGPVKRARRTLSERLESVIEGREGREFGSRKGKDKGGGSTNKKKLKTKSNSMVIHKRRTRAKKTGRREKQLARRRKRDYK